METGSKRIFLLRLTLVQQLRITNGYVGMIKCKKTTSTAKKINLACQYT